MKKFMLFFVLPLLVTPAFLQQAVRGERAQDVPPRAEILQEIARAVSAPLRDFVPYVDHRPNPVTAIPPLRYTGKGNGRNGGGSGSGSWTDPDLQPTGTTATLLPPLQLNFDGLTANCCVPPDTNLAAGATQVVQIANTRYQIFDKATGVSQLGPAAIHTIFSATGGLCGTSDGGDPIVLYDPSAGRWFISQLEYNSNFSTNLVCIAVSTTSDATGSYNLYVYNFGNTLPDYPKFGIWPDAYYMTANMFTGGVSFVGAEACAFNRDAMLAGMSAIAVCFQGTSSLYNLLPSHFDGGMAPSAGEPNFFLQFVDSGGIGSTLNLYKFHVDFANPNNSTFSGPAAIPVGTYHEACGGGGNCVPQAGTTQLLASIGDRLMYRLQYRNFSDHESLVVNHSVQIRSTSNQTGPRWYEIRSPNGTPTVYQQSTYAPDQTTYRWMGSIAQDRAGNMAIGYSSSSSATYPGIYYAGRGASDSLNMLGNESPIINGTGYQTYSRWGDYSSMAVDPIDGCTFWYTTEYLRINGNFNWQTRIASFKFPSCN